MFYKMASKRTVLFYEKCRLCLNDAGAYSVFETDNLQQAIDEIINVQITRDSTWPQLICEICLLTIIKAKELKIMAMKNEVHLKSILGSPRQDQNVKVGSVCTSKDFTDDNPALDSTVILNTLKEEIQLSLEPEAPTITATNESSNSKENPDKEEHVCESTSGSPHAKKRKSKKQDVTINDSAKKKRKTDKQEYVCEKCKKVFHKWKAYYLHKRNHVKAYSCLNDSCDKSFATKGDLQKHMRTHTGEKPYKCEICSKRFSQRVTLKQHYESVHHLVDS